MQVVILCGGLGARLREETEFKPKPMVEIGPRPIVWHIMKHYAHHDIKDFILVLGYKGEVIKNYFYHYELLNNDVTLELGKPETVHIHRRHDEIGWRITLADTGELTLKGARLKRVEQYIDGDTFMVTYGDGLADINLTKLLEFHKSHGKLATVTGVNATARFGELKLNGDRVQAFMEKPQVGSDYINGGFFVFNRGVLQYLTSDPDCDLEYGPLEEIAKAGELMVYKHHGFWACMDTQRDVDFLNNLWEQGKAAWKIW